MLQLIVNENYHALSKKAAQIVAKQVQEKPTAAIGFATGSTPLGLYRELIQMYQRKEVSFDRITTFNLDEYVGLTKKHSQSYYHFMWENFFSKVDIKEHQIHFPDGVYEDADAACEKYERQLEEAGGVDLQILGIGANGHIGFNEPADTFTMTTHIVELAEQTIEANSRFFADKSEVPRKAITMGIGSIMKAKSILLLASDESKAEAIRDIFTGIVDPQIPASILQLHPNVMVLVNAEAASLLQP